MPKYSLIFFISLFYALFLCYINPYYDTIGRFNVISNVDKQKDIFSTDPLSLLGAFLSKYLLVEAYLYFFILYFVLIFLNLKTYIHKNIVANPYIIFLACTIIYIRNIADLTYFTLSTVFFLYAVRHYKMNLVKIVIISVIVYLLHPAVLSVLFPSVFLFYIIKNKLYILSFSFVGIFAYVLFILLSVDESLSLSGIDIVDQFIITFNNYVTSDNMWAKGDHSELMAGIRLWLFNSFVYLLQFFTWVIYLKIRRYVRNYLLLSIYIVSFVLMLVSVKLYTIHERMIVVTTLAGALLILPIFRMKRKVFLKTAYVSLSVIIFFFSLNIFQNPREDIFKNQNSSYEITLRAFYIPSVLLFNFYSYGYSDKYLKQNVIYRL